MSPWWLMRANPNQWGMRGKCLPWRLKWQHLKCSGFSPHYTTNRALVNNSPTLGPDLQSGIIWHLTLFSRIFYPARFHFEPWTEKQLSYFFLTGFDGNISSCTSIFGCLRGNVFSKLTCLWMQLHHFFSPDFNWDFVQFCFGPCW